MKLILNSTLVVLSLFAVVPGVVVCQSPKLEPVKQLLETGKTPEAIVSLKKITGSDKTNAEAWNLLGTAYLRSGEFKNASDAFEKAVRIKPQYLEALNGLAYCLMRRNKFDDAEKAALKALSISAVNADANYIVGVISLKKGNREIALGYARKSLEQNPKLAEAYLLKSQALIGAPRAPIYISADQNDPESKRYREAATAIEKYLELRPDAADKQVWVEQLASLKYYFSTGEGNATDEVYTGKDISTKVTLLSKPAPDYPNARSEKITGTVVLRVVFTSDGRVTNFRVIKGLPNGLTERAIEAARKIKFTPATRNGKPVSMWMQLEYNF